MTTPRPSVLLVGDTLNLGGTEGQFAEIASRLDRSRWDVHVACLRAEGPLRAKLDAAGVQPWSCGRGSFKSPALALAVIGLARYLRAHRIRILHTFDFYSNVMGVPAGRLAGTPAIIASQRDLGNLRPRLQRRVHGLALRLATHVFVNSPAIAERLRQSISTKPGRITVVGNGVDLARFAPEPRREPGPHVLIGALANLRPEKGLADLIEAAALVRRRAPQARFAIWGEGPLRPALDALIRTHQLTDTVELRGSTREPETALRQCAIFVLPSLSEASPNVVLEAMATGLPVVATRVGGTPALVADQQTGLLVPPGEPRALAEALVRLIQAPALGAQLGARAHERARLEFGMDRMLASVEDFYRETLGDQTIPAVRTGAVERA